MRNRISCAFALLLCFGTEISLSAEQPQWGEKFTRNMISQERNLVDSFKPGRRDARTGQYLLSEDSNVRWVTNLGPTVHSTPVVAEGRVLIGSNGTQSDRPQLQGDRGVLSCLDERTGELQWELVVPKLVEIRYADWYNVGMSSVPVVENSKVYLLTNRGEVVCLDLHGMKNGNGGPFQNEARYMSGSDVEPITLHDKDADILWKCDLVEELGVQYHNAVNCAPLIDGDLIYICTGNGVDWTHRRVMNPEAPTLIVLDKNDGTILARDRFGMGPNIIHGQWSSPSLGVVNGRKLIFQGTGSGEIFAVEALSVEQAQEAKKSKTLTTLKTVWKFNGHPLAQKQEVVPREHHHDTRSYEVIGNPVFYNGRVYVVFTQEMFHNLPDGWLLCIDADGSGDVTRSGKLRWSYEPIASSASTVAIADGLLYIGDRTGKLHCLDSETGEAHWVQPLGSQIWGSPLIADGKVYLGTSGRRFFVFEHGKEMKILSQTSVPGSVHGSATAANGTVYVPTFGAIYAVGQNGDL